MAGGQGSRLAPVTKVVNKHLLPVFQKPMIYYALSNLVLLGLKEIVIITNPKDVDSFQNLLSPIFSNADCELKFITQDKPNGIAEVFNLIDDCRNGRDVLLHLGDNLFFGHDFISRIEEATNGPNSTIFSYQVKDPEAFGVIKFNGTKAQKIVEKPKSFVSDWIVTGLYFYKDHDVKLSKVIHLSDRNELEITDMNNEIITNSKLDIVFLQRGDIWFDCGSFDDLANATQFIRTAEGRHTLEIGNLEQIIQSRKKAQL